MATANTKAWHVGFKWTIGDASNPTGMIGVDNTSKALHIADIADQGTDWNVAAYTNPTLVVHSATTPATDYISLDHDATDGTINVASGNLKLAISGTDEVTLTASALSPATSNGNALGTTDLMWADLFLASGGVINFNNGDVTVTHNSNYISVGGGGLDIAGVTGLTTGAVLRMGTSGSPLTDDQNGTGFIVGYFDTGDTAGWPAGLFINTNVTGVGGSFTALQGDAIVSAAKATVTGIESFFQFVTPGKVTGAARACQATIDFGSYDLGSGGVYSAACFNIKGEGAAVDIGTTQRVSCLELKTEGTFSAVSGENFETKTAGYAIYINGFTSAGGVTNILSSTSLAELPAGTLGLRVGVGADGDAGTAYYIPLVVATAWN